MTPTRDELVALAHLPTREIAALLGFSVGYLNKLHREYGIQRGPVRKARADTSWVTAAWLEERCTWSVADLAMEIGCDKATVDRIFRRLGVTRVQQKMSPVRMNISLEWLEAHKTWKLKDIAAELCCDAKRAHYLYKKAGIERVKKAKPAQMLRSCPCKRYNPQACYWRLSHGLPVWCEITQEGYNNART